MVSDTAIVLNKRMSASRRRDLRDGLLFTLPFILGTLLLWVGPMLYSIYLLGQEWNLITPPEFVGLRNFQRLGEDPRFLKVLYNTFYFTFFSVPLQLVVAFALALLINQKMRGISFYRVIFYLPSITPAVAFAVVWIQILNAESGILNQMLGLVGLPRIKWLFDPAFTRPAFVLMSLWLVGPQMIIFLAGLQSVSLELLDAAQIDGANTWQRFRNITVPTISPIFFFNLVIGVIGSFQVFTNAFIMTRGGPQDSTRFMVLHIYYNGFDEFRMGYAAVLSWILFLIIMIFTVIQFRFARIWVYYEAGSA